VTLRQHAVLFGVMIFGAFGDIALSRGMKDVGHISVGHLGELISAIFTPWVGVGILLLLLFFAAYLTALSFADLTYVLPATAIGYIIMALMAKFFLHEHISAQRWAGIALITLGVGFVTSGPAQTPTARGVAQLNPLPPAGTIPHSRSCSSDQELGLPSTSCFCPPGQSNRGDAG
jgi:drug/metabolite transporter (DMT)-like permease